LGRFDIDRMLDDLGISKEAGEGASPSRPEMSDAGTPSDSVMEEEKSKESGGSSEEGEAAIDRIDRAADRVEHLSEEIDAQGASIVGRSPLTSFISARGIETTTGEAVAFVRHDPDETSPRPPDVTGRGLDAEVELSEVVKAEEDPNRLRPTDALTPLWSPTESDGDEVKGGNEELGDVLRERGVINAIQLETARSILKQTPGATLPSALAEMGIDEELIQPVVAELNGLPFERIDLEDGFNLQMANRLGLEFCGVHNVLPLRREGRWIVLGMASPDDVFLLDDIRRRLGGNPIRQVLVTSTDIALVIEFQVEDQVDDSRLDDILADIAEDDVEIVEEGDDDADFEKEAGESPVIRYVNYIIQTALKEGASDIHIEPGETKLKVRFRIDGILFERMNPIAKMHAAIISRLKIMANLDISERRIPQDGRIRAVVNGRKLDLRISTLPTVAGEKCVMRILDSRSISVGLDQLGFSDDTLTIWQHQIRQPHGIILVTGPTGSGKTTTLYSSLREMDTSRLNVSTVEDPVEYHLANITQTQIHDKIGFNFAMALRSLLRQDPDVVMVGEIRDTETAKIAVQASLTGHLVLSTLHTNDAPSSVTRLINIGVEPFLIGSALNAILAQRLVRRICESCKGPQELNDEMADFLAMTGNPSAAISVGSGCDKCRQTGYSGRLGIYEMLVINDSIRDVIAKNPNVSEFRRMCIERGMISLRHDGLMKVADGLTTIEEVLRVTESTI